jgi:hypothetical protein
VADHELHEPHDPVPSGNVSVRGTHGRCSQASVCRRLKDASRRALDARAGHRVRSFAVAWGARPVRLPGPEGKRNRTEVAIFRGLRSARGCPTKKGPRGVFVDAFPRGEVIFGTLKSLAKTVIRTPAWVVHSQQKVKVEHVDVHAGGQAVVGVVEARGEGIGRFQRIGPMEGQKGY